MKQNSVPGLFGITNSNRNYTRAETWGKNQFNSSFPVALSCYLHHRGMDAVYVKADATMKANIDYISVSEVFNINPLEKNAYFAFETSYTPFQKYVIGSIPRNDISVIDLSSDKCISSLEIKLTALPDNTTCLLSNDKFGSEIVVRPDTIIYLACSFIELYKGNQEEIGALVTELANKIDDWTQAKNILPFINEICAVICKIANDKCDLQSPIVLNPVWKTEGKCPQLSDNCLDVFVWSNLGILNLFMPNINSEISSISRHTRSVVWLFKMLSDYANDGKFDGAKIIDELSYNTKNDKAFATSGIKTNYIMSCAELTTPRIRKDEIKKIILGGGQNLLSPERRFDAIIYNSPDLFKEEWV